MFFKVIYSNEVHYYNPKDKPSLIGLKTYIESAFRTAPTHYHLHYLDEEYDEITLASENDFKIMIETSGKIVKIFIKKADESCKMNDETTNVLLDDEIESTSRKDSVVEEEEKEFINIVEEPKVEEKKPLQEEPKEEPHIESISSSLNESNISSITQVTEADIEKKFNQMLPDLIGKVKEELVKESKIKSEIKPKSEVKSEKHQVKEQKVIHRGYICDECGAQDFEGVRYKCAICSDFDLCQKCEAKTTHDHPFLKIKHPRHSPIKILAVMKDDHNSFEVNGQRVSPMQFPFINDMYEAFFGPREGDQKKEGFKIPNLFKGYCPFAKKEEKKWEQKPVKEEMKVEPEIKKKVEEKPVEPKVEEKKVKDEKETETKKMMENASYLASILEIDYNRCYKFAMRNPKLSQEELLELYFQNTSAL